MTSNDKFIENVRNQTESKGNFVLEKYLVLYFCVVYFYRAASKHVYSDNHSKAK